MSLNRLPHQASILGRLGGSIVAPRMAASGLKPGIRGGQGEPPGGVCTRRLPEHARAARMRRRQPFTV